MENQALRERYDALTTGEAPAEPFCDTTMINSRRFVVYLTPRFIKA